MFLRFLILSCLWALSSAPSVANERVQSTPVPPLTEWRAFPAFPVGSPAWECATLGASGDWWVYEDSGEVLVAPYQDEPVSGLEVTVEGFENEPVRATLAVDSGLLVGIDRREWGGRLVWIPESRDEPEILFEDNVIDLVQAGSEQVLVLFGRTHSTMSRGGILWLEWSEDSWTVGGPFDLGGEPKAWARGESGHFWIVTADHLFRVSREESVEILETDLARLYASSMVVRPGQVFLGMLHAVVRFDLEAGGDTRETWLVPPTCTRTILEENRQECRCLAEEPLTEDFEVAPIEGPPRFPLLYDSRWLLVALSLLVLGICLWQIFHKRA